MNFQRILSKIVGLSLVVGCGLAAAQTDASKAGATRDQVKMERTEFLRTHVYDAGRQDWMLKPGFEAPTGVMSRAEIKAARDQFLSMHRWNAGAQEWVKLPGPREMSKVTRAQVKMERDMFIKTMMFNNETGTWSAR
jgi:hypothetical protein